MAKELKVTVPDIGDYDDVPVIEVLVKAGDKVEKDAPLVTLESDKATLDVPAPEAGTVKSVTIKTGDKVSKGDAVLVLELGDGDEDADAEEQEDDEDEKDEPKKSKDDAKEKSDDAPEDDSDEDDEGEDDEGEKGKDDEAEKAEKSDESKPAKKKEDAKAADKKKKKSGGGKIEVTVPDIGDYDDVPVIEVLVKDGDTVEKDATLLTLESDKATLDVPAPAAGVISGLTIKVGDKVSKGAAICTLESGDGGVDASESEDDEDDATADADSSEKSTTSKDDEDNTDKKSAKKTDAGKKDDGDASSSKKKPDKESAKSASSSSSSPVEAVTTQAGSNSIPYASPSIRKFARELGVDLAKVKGSGHHERITQEDVQGFVKKSLAAPAGATSSGAGIPAIPAIPAVDFSQFGSIETKPLARIRKLSAAHLHRSWLNVPHVTQDDEADITELEAFRKLQNEEAGKDGAKLTLLPFIMKAVAKAIDAYPEFASSLSPDGENLIHKQYRHIGFAADTPNGLVVPVVRDVDKKGVVQLAQETAELASRARDGKLKGNDMKGGVFSISSLGGIGGSHFTPIVNAPEVGILGVSRGVMKPVWDGKAFQPRLMVPLSLSYDHRVIDGAYAARFIVLLVKLLSDLRRLAL